MVDLRDIPDEELLRARQPATVSPLENVSDDELLRVSQSVGSGLKDVRFQPESAKPSTLGVPGGLIREQAESEAQRQRIVFLGEALGPPADIRMPPESQVPASTSVGIAPMPQSAVQPVLTELGKRRLGFLESAEEVGGGLVSGAIGGVKPRPLGSPLERVAYKYADRPAYKVAEFIGTFAPFGIASKMAGAIGKAPTIARIATKVPSVVRGAAHAATTGGILAGAREASRILRGEPPEIKEVFKEAATFGAADVVLRGAGKPIAAIAKKIARKAEPELQGGSGEIVNTLENFWASISAPEEARAPVRLLEEEISSVVKRVTEKSKATGGELKKEIKEALKTATQEKRQRLLRHYGIALRTTKGGKTVPAIRKAGVYVPEDFVAYEKFQDVRPGMGGGFEDITRLVQHIDGNLPAEAKAMLPKQAGPTEYYVLHRTREMMVMARKFLDVEVENLRSITQGLSRKQRESLEKLLPLITRKGAYVAPEKLVKNRRIAALVGDDVALVRKAQESRKWLDRMLKLQNRMRNLRGQDPIPYRERYSPHELKKNSIWSEIVHKDEVPKALMAKPPTPDFVKPNKPFNAHAMAREANMPGFMRERDIEKLLYRYLQAATRDIFNTSIIQNNKAFIQALESKGLRNSANALAEWTAEAFAGIKPGLDRKIFGTAGPMGRILERAMNRFRRGLVLGVFPLNIAWNLVVQPSSAVLTVTRYGVRDSAAALWDWFANPALRREIAENAYSYIVKSARFGKVTRQDINRGILRANRLERGPLVTAANAFNFFTEWIERNITGWSVATGLRHGAKRGFKGKALWQYASDAGAKTQSMYNLEDLPGILRNNFIKTIAPFQTFTFEVFNTMRELAGRTGTPPPTAMERMKWVLRFLGTATAANIVGEQLTGRQPWEVRSAVPFYQFLEIIPAAMRGESLERTAVRGMPATTQAAVEMVRGINTIVTKGDWDRFRRAAIKYLPGLVGIPGGLQASRIVDSWIAIAEGGERDASGRLMFPIVDSKEQARALFSGTHSTKAGQQYWRKHGPLGKEPETVIGYIWEHVPGAKEVKGLVNRMEPSGKKGRRSRPKR